MIWLKPLMAAVLVLGQAAAAQAGFSERDFPIGQDGQALPGTLALPDGEGPFPAVVLVHGSGPHDRDGTFGPNRPLRDIAHGLAGRGIAVLRYDKRTRVHPFAFASNPEAGVDEESTDDAVAAIAALRATPGIDPERVFVFGHSLGAMLAPRIVQRAEAAAGGILFAASARKLLDLIPEQMARMARLQGNEAAAASAEAMLDRLADATARLRAGETLAAAEAPLGLSVAYLRSTEALDPVAEARALEQPLLIMHGGRDIQVTALDWQAWQDAFDADPRVTLRHYPELGHLGIPSDPDDPLAAYQQPGRVDESLLDDVAAWILAVAPASNRPADPGP